MVDIEEKLYSDIKKYCKVNNLKIGEFINKLLKKAFMVEKYGEKPPFFIGKKAKEENNESTIENFIIETPKEKDIIEDVKKEVNSIQIEKETIIEPTLISYKEEKNIIKKPTVKANKRKLN